MLTHCDLGSAYVFSRVGSAWSLQSKLKAEDDPEQIYFGHSVAIYADNIIIGAHYGNGNDLMSGTVYSYSRQTGTLTWSLNGRIISADGKYRDSFGQSVSLQDDFLVVGADGDSLPTDNMWEDQHKGSAYVFSITRGSPPHTNYTYTLLTKLTASDALQQEYFAKSVSISDDYIAVGKNTDSNYAG